MIPITNYPYGSSFMLWNHACTLLALAMTTTAITAVTMARLCLIDNQYSNDGSRHR